MKFEVYTDGGYSMRADMGAFAYVILQDGEVIDKYSEKIERETNNRAEIKAISKGVLSLPNGSEVIVYSDSQYALGVLSGAYRALKNTDLVSAYKAQVKKKGIDVTYYWVKGHSGNKWNELCDKMCNEAAGLDLNEHRFNKGYEIPTLDSVKADIPYLSSDDLDELMTYIENTLNQRDIDL